MLCVRYSQQLTFCLWCILLTKNLAIDLDASYKFFILLDYDYFIISSNYISFGIFCYRLEVCDFVLFIWFWKSRSTTYDFVKFIAFSAACVVVSTDVVQHGTRADAPRHARSPGQQCIHGSDRGTFDPQLFWLASSRGSY